MFILAITKTPPSKLFKYKISFLLQPMHIASTCVSIESLTGLPRLLHSLSYDWRFSERSVHRSRPLNANQLNMMIPRHRSKLYTTRCSVSLCIMTTAALRQVVVFLYPRYHKCEDPFPFLTDMLICLRSMNVFLQVSRCQQK